MSQVDKDRISYISVPSLKIIATVRVAAALNVARFDTCENQLLGENRFYAYEQIGRANLLYLPGRNKSFVQREKIISILPLPDSLKPHIARTSMHMYLQRFEWFRLFKSSCFFTCDRCNECTCSPYWTNEGTLDGKKSVEQLIINESKHCLNKVFQVACHYCLETYIPEIWNKLPEATKSHYLRSIDVCYKYYNNHLVAYWIHFVNDKLPEILLKIKPHDRKSIYNVNYSIHRNMFSLGLFEGNVMAVKYFWRKLADDEKCLSLAQWVNCTLEYGEPYFRIIQGDMYQRTNGFSDILYFLLSQMDSNQQRKVFRKNSHTILNSLFFNWPWQRFLLPTLQVMWDYLDEEVYVSFMSLVFKQTKEGYGSEDILKRVWNISPDCFRNCFIQYILHAETGNDILFHLILMKDVDTIKILLSNIDSDERKRLIFSTIENKKLCDVILADKLDVFDMLVKNTLVLKSDVHDLKERVVRLHGTNLFYECLKSDNIELLEKFSAWAFTSLDKMNEFKIEIIDKAEILHRLLSHSNFELADKFLNWSYTSKEEINEFKKHFALSNCAKVLSYCLDNITMQYHWLKLERFVRWCFVSEDTVNEFKSVVLQNFSDIRSEMDLEYHFEFFVNLIKWCCQSEEEIEKYERKYRLSLESMK